MMGHNMKIIQIEKLQIENKKSRGDNNNIAMLNCPGTVQ